jgi:hypothetical protein
MVEKPANPAAAATAGVMVIMMMTAKATKHAAARVAPVVMVVSMSKHSHFLGLSFLTQADGMSLGE